MEALGARREVGGVGENESNQIRIISYFLLRFLPLTPKGLALAMACP